VKVERVAAVVIGGGAVGIALALLLEEVLRDGEGRVALMSKPQAAGEGPPRWYSLNHAGMALLRRLGVNPPAVPFTDMRVVDLTGGASFYYQARELGVDALGCTVDERQLVRALEDKLQQSGVALATAFASIERRQDEWLCVDTQGESYSAPLVFAADGSRSQATRQVGMTERREWASGDTALIANLHTDQPFVPEARQWFSPEGVIALLPDDQQGYSLVWSSERGEALTQLEDEPFVRALEQATASQAGRVRLSGSRAAFPIHTHVAGRLTDQGFTLVGNAACTIHPLAGQGLNLAYWGLARLADCLQTYGAFSNPGAKALYNWQAQALPVNHAYWLLMRQLRQVFRTTNPLVTAGRSALIRHCFSRRIPAALAADFAMHGVRI